MKSVKREAAKKFHTNTSYDEMTRHSNVSPFFKHPPYHMTETDTRFSRIRHEYPIGAKLMISDANGCEEEVVSGYEIQADRVLVVFDSGTRIDYRRIAQMIV